jgi:hypothetical protein
MNLRICSLPAAVIARLKRMKVHSRNYSEAAADLGNFRNGYSELRRATSAPVATLEQT